MNEFLKNTSRLMRQTIVKVFNDCLNQGVYPWNVALITPIHKKGNKYDPDNYRAIAVGSNLGKLFAGANGYFFVKLDFEIAVDQQTKTSDRTFEGVTDPNRQTVPAGQPCPYLVQIRPNLAKYPEHAPYPYFMCSSCS